jgi:hypothetical protein
MAGGYELTGALLHSVDLVGSSKYISWTPLLIR